MKPPAVILTSVLCSVVASATVAFVVAPDPVAGARPAGPRSEGDGAPVAELAREVAAQGELLADLERRLELRRPDAAPVREPAEDLEAVVRRVLAEEAGTGVAASVDGGAASAEASGDDSALASEFTVEGAVSELARMHAGGAGFESVGEYWTRLREAGVPADEILSAFERFAKERPNDPNAQVMLGNAYIQRLQESRQGPEMGQWAMRADTAYDDALELDPDHWDARFSKAVSLSFWPPIFGKQGEAISQFETLLDQQRSAPAVEPQYAQTYLLLGNLYQQQGDADEAKKLWQEGYDLFPEDEELADKTSAGNGG